MKEKGNRALRLLGLVLALTAAISLVVLIIALISRWNTSIQYSNGFFTAGAIMAIISTFIVLGGFRARSDFKTTFSQSAGDASLSERTQRMMKDVRQGYGALILFVGTAALLILLSVLIGQFG